MSKQAVGIFCELDSLERALNLGIETVKTSEGSSFLTVEARSKLCNSTHVLCKQHCDFYINYEKKSIFWPSFDEVTPQVFIGFAVLEGKKEVMSVSLFGFHSVINEYRMNACKREGRKNHSAFLLSMIHYSTRVSWWRNLAPFFPWIFMFPARNFFRERAHFPRLYCIS